MAASRLRLGDIACVIVGADRIAANGDVANKIGTYGLALAARAHGVPFYVAAPSSTVDPATPDGPAIPIEERAADEVASWRGTRDRAGRGEGLESGLRRDAGGARSPRSSPTAACSRPRTRRRLSCAADVSSDGLSILALDQGTTGSTALVIHQDGSVLGRGLPRVHPALSPARLGRARRRGDLPRLARRHARGAGRLPASGRSGSGSPTSARPWCSGTAARSRPSPAPSSGRTAAPADRCRELRESRPGAAAPRAHRPRRRSLLLRHQAGVAAARSRLRRRAGPGRARRGHGRELAGGEAHRRPGSRDRPHQRLPHAAVRPSHARLGPGAAAAFRRARARCCPPSSARPAWWQRPTPRTWDGPCRSPASPATSRPRCSARAAVAPGLAKNTYGTGAFLLVLHRRSRCPSPAQGLLATAACGPRGEPAYALEGSVFIAGAAVQWLRDGLGLIEHAAETEALARSVPDTGGVHFVPAFVGLGTPHWEAEARGTITGLTRGTTRAHLARAALEAMAFSSAELLEAMAGAERARGARAPGGRRRGGQRLADAVPGRRARHPGRAARHGRDDGARRRGLAGIALGVWRSTAEFLAGRRFTRFEPANGSRGPGWQALRDGSAAVDCHAGLGAAGPANTSA